jgi:MraZ protein
MLLGQHEHSLDDKNRLTLPVKLREQLGEDVVVTRGMDGCLYVYARAAFDERAAEIGSLGGLSAAERSMQRLFFATSVAAGLDKQGRMVIPSTLLDGIGIGREVTVAGVGDHLEIWDRAAWRTKLQEMEGSAEDVAEQLADRI